MDIEALIEKHTNKTGWAFAHDSCEKAMRAALTELAAEHEQRLADMARAVDTDYEQLYREANERIRQLEAERGPEGWKLVPVEPTDEMIDHGCDAADAYRIDIARAYAAMLLAAPQDGNHD